MIETIAQTEGLEVWPLSRLKLNPLNPRGPVDPSTVEELAASIRTQGILQPLLVTPDGWIVAGHRRHAAAKLANRTDAPVLVRDLSPVMQLEIMLTENLQREDLSPVQEAKAYQALLDQGRKQTDIARQIGVPSTRIQSRLAILRLQPTVQLLFDRGEIPLHAATLLARVVEPHQQARFGQLIAGRRLTVDKLKEIVNGDQGIRVLPKGSPGPSRAKQVAEDEEDEGEGEPDPASRVTRTAAMALLEARPTRTVTFADLLGIFDDICGICSTCGMSKLEDICRECPLPQAVRQLSQAAGS